MVEQMKYLVVAGLLVAFGGLGCDAQEESAEETSGQIAVETLLGDEVLVDDGEIAGAEPGEEFDVPAGEYDVKVNIGDESSEAVAVTVEAGAVETVEIPWSALPVQQRQKVPLAIPDQRPGPGPDIEALSEEASEELGVDIEFEQPDEEVFFDEDTLEQFVDATDGEETPAGQPVVVDRAEGMAGSMGIQLEAGDRIFAVDSTPIDDIEAVRRAVNEVADGQGDRSVTMMRDGEKLSLDYSAEAMDELVD